MSGGVKTRAMAGVDEKGGGSNGSKKPVLTKPVAHASSKEGEVVSDVEIPPPPAKKRRKKQQIPEDQGQQPVFRHPLKCPVKRKKSDKSSKTTSSDSSLSIQRKKVA